DINTTMNIYANLNNTSAHNKDTSHKFSQLMEGVS
ncbi:integrase, partial [Staphylococcus aureus]|nr:integrase [Staphylococcus aureus]